MALEDLKKIMQHSYSEYSNKFFLSAISNKRAFEGKYRPCKIFKYIIDHNCKIDDLKMIVLEKCDEEDLYKKEQYYLSTYLPSFFGFNQIATITEQFEYSNNPELKRSIIKNDLLCFKKYMEYGYSTFNYLHSFLEYGNSELNQKVNLLLSNSHWLSKNERLKNTLDSFEEYQNTYKESYREMSNVFSEQVHNIFCKYKLKSKARETEVLSVFINPYHIQVILDDNSTLEYLKYYFDRDKNSKECSKSLKALYDENIEKINEISTPARTAYEHYLQSKKSAIDQSEYSIIFPNNPF